MKKTLENIKGFLNKNNRKSILKNYYSQEIRKGKNYRASILDKALIVVLIYLVMGTYISVKSNYVLLSFFLTGITLFFGFKTIMKPINRRKQKKIRIIHEDLKRKRLVREFSNFNNKDFINYMQKILEDYHNAKVRKAESPLDLKSTIEGDIYGIKCIRSRMEDKINLRQVQIFHEELEHLGIKNGIIITNSFFRDDVQDETEINLYDFDKIIDILKKINKYPTDIDIEDYIIDRFTDRKNTVRDQFKTIDKKKIFQLYGIFAILYILSFFVRYSLYYKITAVIIFVFATIVGGYKLSEYNRLRDKDLSSE